MTRVHKIITFDIITVHIDCLRFLIHRVHLTGTLHCPNKGDYLLLVLISIWRYLLIFPVGKNRTCTKNTKSRSFKRCGRTGVPLCGISHNETMDPTSEFLRKGNKRTTIAGPHTNPIQKDVCVWAGCGLYFEIAVWWWSPEHCYLVKIG